MTQVDTILNWLEEKGEIRSWDITNLLRYQQYNARISDARKKIGCVFVKREHSPHCPSHKHILSDRDNHFVLVKDQLPEKKEIKPMPQYSSGYQKFQEAGKKLKGNQPKRQYEDLTTEELETKKQTAESWLEANKTHTNYAEALRRYEQICDELTYRQAKESLL